MDENDLEKKNDSGFWKFILFSTLFFFALLAALFTVFFLVRQRDDSIRREEISQSEMNLNESERNVIVNQMERLTSDLLYIRETVQLSGLDWEGLESLKKQWAAFSDSTRRYDQIRYLDASGNEIIRVNYYQDGAQAVADAGLGNKADFDYFKKSIGLDQNQIFISGLVLNSEQNTVEQPDKPVIRLAIPYFDDAGVKKGEVVLNYFAEYMLDNLRKMATSSYGSTYLLNSDGYWLYNSEDSSKEWTFMFSDKKDISFADTYPEEWALMQEENTGNFTTSNGFFSFTSMKMASAYEEKGTGKSLVLGENDWRIVSRLDPSSESGSVFTESMADVAIGAFRTLAPFWIFIWALALVIAGFYRSRKMKKQKLQYQSDYDQMTGVLNRRAGLEKLHDLNSAGPGSLPFAVCFIDINGLKQVNDTLGHEAGDSLILNALSVIKKCVSASSDIVRLGGDEFLIILRKTMAEDAEKVWTGILAGISEVNEKKELPFTISVSHGIAEARPDESDEDLVDRADRKMYEEKREYKRKQAGKT